MIFARTSGLCPVAGAARSWSQAKGDNYDRTAIPKAEEYTRAALTGLRKAGFEIAATKSEDGKPTRYRITAEPDAERQTSGSAEVAHAG